MYLALLLILGLSGALSSEAGGARTLDEAVRLIEGRNPAKALSVLSGYRPAPEELSSYHRACARALEGAQKYHSALAHYRLAFIYADREAKEQLLLDRADFLMRIMNYHEAVLAYKVFLTYFRDSLSAEAAHLGLANALYKTGRYTEAHAHYRMAGNGSVALSGRAKALHFLGRVREASEIFQSLLDNDRSFLRSSQEAIYVMGENLRLQGKLPEAKLYLSTAVEKPWKEWAEKSLASIAAEEGRPEAALKLFQSAARTSDRRLRPEALLALAELNMKMGKADEAKAGFLEIRNGYPFGRTYDRALLGLSRMYRAAGQTRESESLLNELLFRQNPPKEALDEIQALLMALTGKNSAELARIWPSVGRRLLEPGREESLLAISKGLRHSGKPFLELHDWLMKYGSPEAKAASRLAMAEFYVSLGETDIASRYLNGAKLGGPRVDLSRVEARVSLARGEYQKSFSLVRSLQGLTAEDASVLAELAGPLGRDKVFLDFFGRSLDTLAPGAGLHLRYADAAAAAGRKSEASDHYTAALALQETAKEGTGDDRKWCLYRLARLVSASEAVGTLRKMESGNDVFGRFSRAALKEASVTETMERIF